MTQEDLIKRIAKEVVESMIPLNQPPSQNSLTVEDVPTILGNIPTPPLLTELPSRRPSRPVDVHSAGSLLTNAISESPIRADTIDLELRIQQLPLLQSHDHVTPLLEGEGRQSEPLGHIPSRPGEISTESGIPEVVSNHEPLPSTSAQTNPVPVVGGLTPGSNNTVGARYAEFHQRAMQSVIATFPEMEDPIIEKILAYVSTYMTAYWTHLKGSFIPH